MTMSSTLKATLLLVDELVILQKKVEHLVAKYQIPDNWQIQEEYRKMKDRGCRFNSYSTSVKTDRQFVSFIQRLCSALESPLPAHDEDNYELDTDIITMEELNRELRFKSFLSQDRKVIHPR